jgi:murein DD-endopeptidase MepM/ murein hydrolase activator NlpD
MNILSKNKGIKISRYLKIGLLVFILAGLLISAPAVLSQYASVDDEINALNLKIQNQKKQLDELEKKQQEYQKLISAKQNEKASLNNQLAILENRLAKTQLDIDGANLEIDKTGLEIKKIEIDSQDLDEKIEKQKVHIANLLRLVYKQDQITTLEMLLLNDSLTDFLNQAKYLENTNEELGASVEELKTDKERLDRNKEALAKKTEELQDLKKQLEEKKNSLSYEQENKNYLLEETKSSEREFQALLQQAKKQQQQAQAEIANAEQLIRQKMSEKDRAKLDGGNNTIAWPVKKNVITALFHDPDYPYRKIIGEHSGVDIRAGQGSALMAAADGYVAKVKFAGDRSYAYIMIIHGDGLATVYGHVSAVYVKTDQYVTQGQKIGLTGGMPGGIGSGYFSTGPHLHFEVRLNGLPVNPLNYLP